MTPITPKNITRHELIGLEVKIVESSSKTLAGVSGRIVDETMNMLIINSEGKLKKAPKKNSRFQIQLPDGRKVEVEGRQLVGRPEDRVKKAVPGRW
ncbi:ribonuclease P protein component 1 [Candidatus Hecatella orcuttiae]|uniref:ribonuclease P protein component 1 n=1 Tax=Candidatus Hecatella orcuttiae TaxID=1935119 RepID=UPI002867B804|nr:ribonuclease P protein component 1 [Candidatus Hecatella orcuttiae]